MLLLLFVMFFGFTVVLITMVWTQQSHRERTATSAICPKCGHEAKVYKDDKGTCMKCRAKLIRTPDGSIIVK